MPTRQTTDTLIIPRPLEVIPGGGHFQLDGRTFITTAAELAPTARYLQELIQARTGLSLQSEQGAHSAGASNTIDLASSDGETELGEEGYILDVTPGEAAIRAG
jgi:hypothetical protein